jgi:molybdopterin synthase catalytic subunit
MRLNILLFGPMADIAGSRVLRLEVPEANSLCATGVLRLLGDRYPLLRPMLTSSRLAINSQFAAPDDAVAESDELALIGMVSGG